MAAKAFVANVIIYPKDKSGDPYPASIAGFMWDPSLSVGGGPIIPPGEAPPEIDNKPPDPPLEIWPPDAWVDFPSHPIVLPDPPTPPEQIPDPPVAVPHPGWNWSVAKSGWYYIYVPGPTDPSPKA